MCLSGCLVSEPIRILLIDDHAIVRSGVRLLIEQEPDLMVVGEAETAKTGIELALELRPDVVVMDISLPDIDGISATRQILDKWRDARLLALTMHGESGFLVPFLEAGGMGYLQKSAVDRQLIRAIRQVAAGEWSVESTGVNEIIAHHRHSRVGTQGVEELSERERQVLVLTARGFTSREIGEQLFISSRTVETYRSRIMEKLDIRHRSGLVEYALDHRLLG